jgi:hypothetical protein
MEGHSQSVPQWVNRKLKKTPKLVYACDKKTQVSSHEVSKKLDRIAHELRTSAVNCVSDGL